MFGFDNFDGDDFGREHGGWIPDYPFHPEVSPVRRVKHIDYPVSVNMEREVDYTFAVKEKLPTRKLVFPRTPCGRYTQGRRW